MLLRFSHLKLIRPNQSTFSSSGITTYLQSNDVEIAGLGGAGTAAPSTIIQDKVSGNQYYLNKPFSAVHAALTAVTSQSDSVNLI